MTLRHFSLPRPYFGVSRAAPVLAPSTGRQPRAPRRAVAGVALTAQKCRLLLAAADGTHSAYPCRVVDVANGGYCITLLGRADVPLQTGQHAVLEQTDKSQTPVELRWYNGAKMGLKRLPRRRDA